MNRTISSAGRTLLIVGTTLIIAGSSAAREVGPAPRTLDDGSAPRERGPNARLLAVPVPKPIDVDALAAIIDREFERFWKQNGITPAPTTDDAEFLRRVTLDLAGRIPTVAEARAFLESKDADKRSKKIDELIGKSSYLNYYGNVLRQTWVPEANENPQFQFVGFQFEEWVRRKLQEKVPLDQVVREILTAPTLFGGRGQPVNVNPRDVPFGFNQVNEFKPENVAAAASRLFMGVKIECAQCHDHPFAPYKRDQFWEIAAFFAEVQPAIANLSDQKLKREIKIPETTKVVQAKFFDGRYPTWTDGAGPRETFARWLTAPENPYFARNMANRSWAHMMGIGLQEPIDEPTDDNPPVIPALMDELAGRFAASKFEPTYLLRAIARSKVYQLTSRLTHESQTEPKTFARMSVKMMSGEQLFDSLSAATYVLDRTPAQQRAFSGNRREFLTRFGGTDKRTERQTSILQALMLMNGRFVNEQTALESSQLLAGVVDSPFWNNGQKVEVLFLASLSRKPTAEEAQKFVSYIDRGGNTGDSKKALTDVFWALLNSTEFILNH